MTCDPFLHMQHMALDILALNLSKMYNQGVQKLFLSLPKKFCRLEWWIVDCYHDMIFHFIIVVCCYFYQQVWRRVIPRWYLRVSNIISGLEYTLTCRQISVGSIQSHPQRNFPWRRFQNLPNSPKLRTIYACSLKLLSGAATKIKMDPINDAQWWIPMMEPNFAHVHILLHEPKKFKSNHVFHMSYMSCGESTWFTIHFKTI